MYYHAICVPASSWIYVSVRIRFLPPSRPWFQSVLGSIVKGVFTPVLAKHTKSFNLVDTLSVGVDRIERNFEPMQRQVETWRQTQITDAQAKLIFYSAFVDGNSTCRRACCPRCTTFACSTLISA